MYDGLFNFTINKNNPQKYCHLKTKKVFRNVVTFIFLSFFFFCYYYLRCDDPWHLL